MTVFELIQSDLYRYAGKTSAAALLREYFCNHSFRFQCWLRIRQSHHGFMRLLGRLGCKYYSRSLSVFIPKEVKIGYGLFMPHPIGIVLNPTTVIGHNCNLSHFTSVGANHGQAAVIGDHVYLGPHVCLIENVRIGDHATLGAGCIVVADTPAGVTVAGNPARVISTKTSARYIINPYVPTNLDPLPRA